MKRTKMFLSLNIHESWVAQCYWTEHCSQRDDPNTDSVGIHLMGDDHTLMGVTVFDWVSVGIRIEQPMSGTGGNLLQGVHVWNGGTNGNVQGPGIAVSCSCPHLDSFFCHLFLLYSETKKAPKLNFWGKFCTQKSFLKFWPMGGQKKV